MFDVTRDNKQLVSWSLDGSNQDLQLWGLATGKKRAALRGKAAAMMGLSASSSMRDWM